MPLAIDIDDTLCQTTLRWTRLFQKEFGNPEGLTAEQLVEKYEIVQYVPYRQTLEAKKLIDQLVKDDRNWLKLPIISWAQQAITILTNHYDLLYLTSRTEEHRLNTRMRLENHDFPQLDLIMRPNASKAYTNPHTQFDRKAQYLVNNYPHITGIIDNSESLANHLIQLDYKGILILFGHTWKQDFPEDHQLHTRADTDKIFTLLENQ